MPLRLIKRGSIYYLRGTVAGLSVYESTGLGDRRAAEIKRARREAELIERSAFGRAATLTFAEAALAYIRAGGETRYLAPLIAHFGPKRRLSEIDNDAVAEAARALYPTAAPATINRQVVTPISAVYTMAAQDGHAPPRSFRRRKAPPPRLRWLTPEEAERLIRAGQDKRDHRTLAAILFMLGTGCRTGEALALTVQHLHLDTAQAWIADAKNGEARMVDFPDRTRRFLAASGLPEAGAVFRTPKGLPYKLHTGSGGQMQTAFNALRDAAGLGDDVTPHTLRHTWATWYYAATRDFIRLMALGGWKKPDIAIGYTKLAPADLPARLAKHGWAFGADAVQTAAQGEEIAMQIKGL